MLPLAAVREVRAAAADNGPKSNVLPGGVLSNGPFGPDRGARIGR
jgi:hypothetical protein